MKLYICFLSFWVFSSELLAENLCAPPGRMESVELNFVFDGDTIALKDGRKVRFIGVNTPEAAKKGRPAEPYSPEATQFVKKVLNKGVYLVNGQQSKDRYGRTLAYVFDHKGQSVSESLIKMGLGFRVAVSPNVALQDCFKHAEEIARGAGIGVWGESRWNQAADSESLNSGFTLVHGVVEKVSRGGKHWWIDLKGHVTALVRAENQSNFSSSSIFALPGSRMEIRGWMTKRKLKSYQKDRGYKPYMMNLTHPQALQVVDK